MPIRQVTPVESTSGSRERAENGSVACIVADLESCARDMHGTEAFRFLHDGSGPEAFRQDVWTWGELGARARGVARELAATGRVRRGSRVLVCHTAGLDFIAAFMGCLYAGAIPVPVSPPRRRDGLSRWQHISQSAGVDLLLCGAAFRDRFAELTGGSAGAVLVSDAADASVPYRPMPGDAAPLMPQPDDIAFLQYTSGSTGSPRGVMVTHRMIAANLEQIRHAYRFTPADRLCGWLPHYHDMGLIGGILTPIHLGIPNAMMSPGAFLRDPLRYLELATRTGATGIAGPNFGYDHCVRHARPDTLERLDLSGLRFAFSGAEAISAGTLDRFAETFARCGFRPRCWMGAYGLAEATLCVSVSPPWEGARRLGVSDGALARNVLETGAETELVESGAPVDGMDVAIVDPATGQRAAADRIGEIWLRGENVATGYWNDPEATRETFGKVLDGGPGWMRTGDLGAVVDGRLYVTGRLKELIVVRGQNHYPQDIEATVLAAHADLVPARVAAVAMPGGADGRIGIVCELNRHACRDPHPEPVFDAIRAAVSEAHGVVPEAILLVRTGGLPVTPSGKVQRFACRDALDRTDGLPVVAEWRAESDRAPKPRPTAPRGALRQRLAAAPAPLRRGMLVSFLKERLAGAVGASTPPSETARFFDLGLDSVAGAALVAELEAALGLQLDPAIIYEHPTPATLAEALLDRLREERDRPVETAAVAGS